MNSGYFASRLQQLSTDIFCYMLFSFCLLTGKPGLAVEPVLAPCGTDKLKHWNHMAPDGTALHWTCFHSGSLMPYELLTLGRSLPFHCSFQLPQWHASGCSTKKPSCHHRKDTMKTANTQSLVNSVIRVLNNDDDDNHSHDAPMRNNPM